MAEGHDEISGNNYGSVTVMALTNDLTSSPPSWCQQRACFLNEKDDCSTRIVDDGLDALKSFAFGFFPKIDCDGLDLGEKEATDRSPVVTHSSLDVLLRQAQS